MKFYFNFIFSYILILTTMCCALSDHGYDHIDGFCKLFSFHIASSNPSPLTSSHACGNILAAML
jgi:hypothetical protein